MCEATYTTRDRDENYQIHLAFVFFFFFFSSLRFKESRKGRGLTGKQKLVGQKTRRKKKYLLVTPPKNNKNKKHTNKIILTYLGFIYYIKHENIAQDLMIGLFFIILLLILVI